jgi:hypothetical protein
LNFSLGHKGVQSCSAQPRRVYRDAVSRPRWGWTGKNIERLLSTVPMRVLVHGRVWTLNGTLFAVPPVDAELRPSCRINSANEGVLVTSSRHDLSRHSGTSLLVNATTPIILITIEASPIIIAHLPHTISGAETRKPQKVGVAKKKICVQKGRPFLDACSLLGNAHGASCRMSASPL